ncbi:hypothetical protein F4821DRAFT_260323 [Hypoxylon rubiginosum]|uniref:Uncharacterized protein n=1 Tax=Hypoxylon rubiginosum TaxID=110542 RepID=A0ACC0D003_9PEZI|nr:hypothetical protein F4821DRAFT_260323 [Hypoxylon rubiginosum]
MGNIFAHAEEVAIWLSRSTKSMEDVFEYMGLTAGFELRFPPTWLFPSLRMGSFNSILIPSSRGFGQFKKSP